MKRALLLTLTAMMVVSAHAQALLRNASALQSGDLLFPLAESENAITKATAREGVMVDHVAVLLADSVYEALPEQGVIARHKTDFVRAHTANDGTLRLLVRRPKRGFSEQKTLEKMRPLMGRPYDALFLPGDTAIYCSELILLTYTTRHGRRMFRPLKMNFLAPDGTLPPAFRQRYEQAGIPLPQGQPGSNPTQLLFHRRLRAVE